MSANGAMKLFKEAPMILSDGFIDLAYHAERLGAFVAIAKKYALPVQLSAPTPSHVSSIRDAVSRAGVTAIVTGIVSMPERADDLDEDVAKLVSAGVDMLHSHVTGSFEEMQTVAGAMAGSGLPFSVSAWLRPDGVIPPYHHEDGTRDEVVPFVEAIARLDADPAARPWHFILSCIEPSDATRVLEATFRAAPALAHRILGVNGDARGLTVEQFAGEMKEIAERFGLNVMGGCCGMDAEKFDALAAAVGKTNS